MHREAESRRMAGLSAVAESRHFDDILLHRSKKSEQVIFFLGRAR
jgi:hypothetical protein